jgi:hypothetical protein
MTLSDGQYPALKSAALPLHPKQSPAIVPIKQSPAPVEQLYDLIPALYRLRDSAQDEQLRALLAVIESEFRVLEADMQSLYENWFIETSEDWVVPYLGDLLAVRDLNAASPRRFGQERRAYVANTLFYRQRKGTTPVLEQLARDITGWGARAVESLPFVAASQNLNHLRPQAQTLILRPLRGPELLNPSDELLATNPALASLATPFESIGSYTTQIRPSRGDRIRYNAADVAIHLWQLQPYQVESATPRVAPEAELQGSCFRFNPLGQDISLLNLPQTEVELTTLAQAENVPGILTKPLLEQLLRQNNAAIVPVQVQVDGKPQELKVADLSNWGAGINFAIDEAKATTTVLIDPELGRLKLAQEPDKECPEAPLKTVTVSYVEGFSGDVGAGAYDRPDAIMEQPPVVGQLIWRVPSQEALEDIVLTWHEYARKWQDCYDLVNFPVARLAYVDQDWQRIDQDPLPKMQPGILQGLQPIVQEGDIDLMITPGLAIDYQGHPIQLKARHCVTVACHANQTILLTIADLAWAPYWKIRAIPQQNGTYDRLAQEIPLVELSINADGRITNSRTALREVFRPGFVGIEANSKDLVALISDKGSPLQTVCSLNTSADAFAVNNKGQKIRLSQVTSFTLTKPPDLSETILLFITPSFPPLTGKLNIVPDTERAIIEIQGSGTFYGDLSLQIPARKRLYLAASNGDRPHFMGDITLHGIANPETANGGDFILEGILLEGSLTVLPGNLQRLQIKHSTLVPAMDSLDVQKATYEIFDESPEDATLLAFLMYSLTLLRRLIRVGTAAKNLTTVERISQISQITQQQVITQLEGIRYVWQQSLTEYEHSNPEQADSKQDSSASACDDRHALCQPPDETINLDQDNSFLEIAIHRSICGQITLADTVPSLIINESIIHTPNQKSGQAFNQQIRLASIALDTAGADVSITKSTILGGVFAKRLRGEDSIFSEPISSTQQQVGCLRFCYVPSGSRTPPRYYCQPDLALAEKVGAPPVSTTCLAIHPITQQVYAGTAKGILQLLASTSGDEWVPLNAESNPFHATALLVIDVPVPGKISGSSGSTVVEGQQTRFLEALNPGDRIFIDKQDYIVRSIPADNQLQLLTPLKTDVSDSIPLFVEHLLVGTADGKILQAIPSLKSGIGNISVTSTQENGQAIVVGCNSNFENSWAGGLITIGNQNRKILTVDSSNQLTVESAFDREIIAETYLITPFSQSPIVGSGRVSSNHRHDRTKVIGCGTRFQQDVVNGDELFFLGERIVFVGGVVTTIDPQNQSLQVHTSLSRDHVAESFLLRRLNWTPMPNPTVNTRINSFTRYRNKGTGRITSLNRTVLGQKTKFTQELKVGDFFGLKASTEKRKITKIFSDTQLEIETPFNSNLSQPTDYIITGIVAATSGNGTLRSSDDGQHWIVSNQGLFNLNVRAIAYHDGKLFAATFGNGVFCSNDYGLSWAGGDPIDPEIRQTGLADPNTTCLTINPLNGYIFVGTDDGGIFRSKDGGDRWTWMSQNLANFNVSALTYCCQSLTGSISSNYRTVMGNGTKFKDELAIGDEITINGQTRKIMDISPDQERLLLNDAYEPDLLPGTLFEQCVLIAGSRDGTVYRPGSESKTWQPVASLTHMPINAFVVQLSSRDFNIQRPAIFAATQLGSLYYSPLDDGLLPNNQLAVEWRSINNGIPQIEAWLDWLNRIQPRFTDEQYGNPAYAQLSKICPIEIRTGAEDRSEMGVFNFLKRPQREANLQASLKEYLRFGLAADILYASYSLDRSKS